MRSLAALRVPALLITAAPRLLALITATAVAVGPAAAQERSWLEVGHPLGDPAAPVTIVEFADFACTACGQFWRDTWPRIRAELVETGRVYWRHVPVVLGFRHGDRAARAGECAAEQGAFWPMLDRIFETQSGWMKERRPDDALKGLAAELGLDPGAFRMCYDANAPRDRTRAANRAARDAGVRGTPTFVVNGRTAVGALDYATFLRIVEEAERAAR